jgi:hypothetical protein
VLIAVSFLVFVIFIVVPGGDPATRIAGKNANDQLIENIRHTWGFDQPFYEQYWIMMKKTFSGELVSLHEPDERRRADQGRPPRDVLPRHRRRDHLARDGRRRRDRGRG